MSASVVQCPLVFGLVSTCVRMKKKEREREKSARLELNYAVVFRIKGPCPAVEERK